MATTGSRDVLAFKNVLVSVWKYKCLLCVLGVLGWVLSVFLVISHDRHC